MMNMTREDKDKGSGVQGVSEPSAVYGMATEMRVFSEEELSHGIPLEESRRRITEMIYNHFHPQA
jgi:hypothetical protein